ncbi:MAGUK p55 subfamily member 7-like isoform X2 [Ornithodoros turicata]|uniref:MAGUK p55 subfamily member 7-like isoform X2 n=1 Tax=Ornithodoros turicata TaxID=34597 RepID=UPI003139261F
MAVGGKQNGNNSDPALQKLLASLEQVCQKADSWEEDRAFLTQLFQSKALQSLVYIHSRLSNLSGKELIPLSKDASSLAEKVRKVLQKSTAGEAEELSLLILSPHFKGFLEAHDVVARKDFHPTLPEVAHDALEDEETVKIVQLVKSNEPLGATIKYNDIAKAITIARILHGGAADRSGLIHVGDEVHEVNGISVKGKAPHDVVNILQSQDGTIMLKLVPGQEVVSAQESRVRVRALFDYDPMEDPLIPCQEAGLPFRRGQVLHVVSQEDPYWWQARREGNERCGRAGLIPGCSLQERRFAEMRTLNFDSDEDSILHSCSSPLKKDAKPRKIKKVMYDVTDNEDFDRELIATYEEVAKWYPKPGFYRPVVLIGPPGVGRNELKRRLIASDPDRFKTTIPNTSRQRKPWEIDGKDYYFVNRAYMEEEIRRGKFIEHGEYKGNLYGTSIEAVRSIVNAGYVCVMNPHPQALKMLRTAELKPFIIFIKPPCLEVLKETRNRTAARSTFDENCSRGFTDDEFQEIAYLGQKIEFLYGHMFDMTIVNEDLTQAFFELMAVVKGLECEPQWVPVSWVVTSQRVI